MNLLNVWVVEGGSSYSLGSLTPFDLRVDPNGWTLIDATGTSIERLWSWDTIGGLEVVRGVGKTPDGRAATALDVIVNGWPVRVLIPTQDLPNETIAMLGAFAPVGHPLRASLRVKREPAFRRFTEAGRRITGERLRARPAFLLSAASTRLRSALVVGLVLVVTVVVASIAGVATSAQTPGPARAAAHDPTTTQDTGSGPNAVGGNPSAQVPATTSSPTTTPPAVAASSAQVAAGATSTTKAPAKKSTKKSTAKNPTTTKTTTTTKTGVATNPGSGTTGPTAPGTVAAAATTTSTTRPPTTTTTRPRPPTTTTTRPVPTTTQAAPPTTVAGVIPLP